MQASVHRYDDEIGSGSVLLDDGREIPFDVQVMDASGLRLLHHGLLGRSGLLHRTGAHRGPGTCSRGLGKLLRVGDHSTELRAGLELRHGSLLDLDARTGPRVAADPRSAKRLLEGSEAGDADLLALGNRADNDVEDFLDS